MNVGKEADDEFLRLLEKEFPGRHEKLMATIRKANPSDSAVRMTEDQALTNFGLGLPTGQYRFTVIAGKPAPPPLGERDGNDNAFRYRNQRIRIQKARAGRQSAPTSENVALAP